MKYIKPERLPDPQGFIRRVRNKLNANCSVRVSPFCDQIISMRMQGVPFQEIEKWLAGRGEEFRISATTIWRNLKHSKIEVRLTEMEKILEDMGGAVEVDLIREMSNNVLIQKERLNELILIEKARKRDNPNYVDKRITKEINQLTDMLLKLHNVTVKTPDIVREEINELLAGTGLENIGITQEASDKLTQLLLEGEITIDLEDLESE